MWPWYSKKNREASKWRQIVQAAPRGRKFCRIYRESLNFQFSAKRSCRFLSLFFSAHNRVHGWSINNNIFLHSYVHILVWEHLLVILWWWQRTYIDTNGRIIFASLILRTHHVMTLFSDASISNIFFFICFNIAMQNYYTYEFHFIKKIQNILNLYFKDDFHLKMCCFKRWNILDFCEGICH